MKIDQIREDNYANWIENLKFKLYAAELMYTSDAELSGN